MNRTHRITRHRTASRPVRLAAVTVAAAGLFAAQTGCNNAGEGALSGGALGALGGMAIGSLSGDMGKGAAIGAVTGAIGGAVLGDQNERRERRRYRYDDDY